jgi:hypothetical protein
MINEGRGAVVGEPVSKINMRWQRSRLVLRCILHSVDGASAHAPALTVPRPITWKKEGSSIPFSTGKCTNSSNEGNEDGFELK